MVSEASGGQGGWKVQPMLTVYLSGPGKPKLAAPRHVSTRPWRSLPAHPLAVVVHRIHAVRQRILLGKFGKVGAIHVAVEEQDVVRVNLADRLLHALIECDEAVVLGVGRLVHRVVPRDPGVVLVVLGEVLPDLDAPVLVIPVAPDCGGRGGGPQGTRGVFSRASATHTRQTASQSRSASPGSGRLGWRGGR